MRREAMVGAVILAGFASWADAQTPAAAPKPWQQEPSSYRGIPWGAAPSALVPHLEATETGRRGDDFRFIAGKCLCDGGSECPAKKIMDPPPPQRHCFSKIEVGGVVLTETWTFLVDRLAGVNLTFDSGDYRTMRAMFVERYGEPSKTETTQFKTRGGLEAANEELSWDGPTAVVRLENYGGSIREGQANVMTHALVDEMAKVNKEKAAEGAKVF